MYCPRCGEDQVSGNLRFCNRCGLPLELVSEVLSNGGTLPQLDEITKKGKWLTKSKGVIFSIIWFFLWVFITILTAIGDGDDAVAVVFVIGIFGSIFIMLMSLLFLSSKPKYTENQTFIQNQQAVSNNLSGQQTNQNALPPQQSQPAQDYVSPQAGMWKAADTGDLVSPGSVTENTTKLLRKEEKVEQEEKTKYLNNQ